jgi:hypothetical protein
MGPEEPIDNEIASSLAPLSSRAERIASLQELLAALFLHCAISANLSQEKRSMGVKRKPGHTMHRGSLKHWINRNQGL